MTNLITGHFYDIGRREIYEDRVLVHRLTTRSNLNLTVAMVADGVGGSNRGERAAQLAIDVTLHYLTHEGSSRDIPQLLHQAFVAANQAICAESLHTQGATTTLAVAAVHNGRLYIANVGDSRIYLCRNGKLNQLTLDHTFANVMPMLGKMSAPAAASNPRADVLVRYLGHPQPFVADSGFYVDTRDEERASQRGRQGLLLKPGDSVLVCSDGLVKTAVSGQPFTAPTEIVRVLDTQEGDKAARSLVSFALGRNVDDNVSVALIQMPDPKRRRRARRPFLRAFLVATILALLVATFLYANFQQRVNDSEIMFARQQRELEAQTTATAQVVAATTTAEIAAVREQAAATAEFRATQQAITAAAVASTQTHAAAQMTCLQSGSYDFDVKGLTLSPRPGFQHILGHTLPEDFAIQLAWSITNTGLCPLTNPSLFPLGEDNQALRPLWRQADRPIMALAPGETADLTVTLPVTQEKELLSWRDRFKDTSTAWILVVAPQGEGSELSLVTLPSLALADSNVSRWIAAIEPTVTPVPTIAPAPVVPSESSPASDNVAPTDTQLP